MDALDWSDKNQLKKRRVRDQDRQDLGAWLSIGIYGMSSHEKKCCLNSQSV